MGCATWGWDGATGGEVCAVAEAEATRERRGSKRTLAEAKVTIVYSRDERGKKRTG